MGRFAGFCCSLLIDAVLPLSREAHHGPNT